MSTTTLSLAELKKRSLDFFNLIGVEEDAASARIVELVSDDFAVQRGEQPPSTGGRDGFLTGIRAMIRQVEGGFNFEIKHMIAEVCEDGTNGGRCWVYSRKFFGPRTTDSVSCAYLSILNPIGTDIKKI